MNEEDENMGDRLIRKGLVVGIIILFICSNVVSGLNIQLKNTTNPLINTGGYIQGLIDNASDGDTVFIPSGIYYENIIINKSISLIGEDKDTTIIDGGGNVDVVTIIYDEVTVSDFTIQNSGNDSWNDAGVQINSNWSNIIGNFIVNCSQGVYIIPEDEWYEEYTFGNIIAENNIKNNKGGLTIVESKYTKIYDNNIINNGWGIQVMPLSLPIKNDYQCQVFRYYNNKIYRNNVTNNNDGIHLFLTFYDEVYENQIAENNNGIILEGWYSYGRYNNIYQNNVTMNKRGVYISSCNGGSNSNNIYQNNILNNNEGIFILSVGGFLCGGANNNNVFQNNIMSNARGIYINCQFLTNGARYNNIYYNNFIGNTENAYDNSINIWDNGSVGNYWGDYKGKDNNKDGIGDTPYNIRPSWKGNKDNYPLMKPVNNVTKILSIQQNSQSSQQSFSILSSQNVMRVIPSTDTAIAENQLPSELIIDGPTEGYTGVPYTYHFFLTDSEGNGFFLLVDWGDGTYDDWFGPDAEEGVELSHTWYKSDNYIILAKARDSVGMIYGAELNVIITENHPPNKPQIRGPGCRIKVGVSYNYTFNATDTDDDNVSYYIDWGDCTNTGWTGFYPSGEKIIRSHTYDCQGTFIISAKAKDTQGAEGDWGHFFPGWGKGKDVNLNTLKLVEKFPLLERLLLMLQV